jgi:2-polyprenyl-3-methyl-5-hydroxy-6-metoxy-1,4-benzoquinol methylase
MTDLRQRSTEIELMDRPETTPADYAQALADLAQLNRVTMTHRPVLRWLDTATRDLPAGSVVSVLDVASGQGDLLRAMHRWGTRRGLVLRLSGLDLNPASAVEAAAATPAEINITWRTGDVFADVPVPAPDFIVSSQFAHHLDDAQIIALMGWMDQHATRGWLIIDPQRHWFSYYGFAWLARLMRWHRIVRIDGTISVARSLRMSEWRDLVTRAGLAANVRWHLPYRIGVGLLK